MSSQTELSTGSIINLPYRPPGECRVLIVDDDDRIVEAFTVLLAHDGYQTFTARSGAEALRIVDDMPPDVIVLDVRLPGMDGIEVCRTIKANHSTHFIQVILVTGMTARDRRIDGLKAGADEFLDKPIDPLELTTRVRSLLRTKQLYDAVEAHRQDLEKRVEQRTEELREANKRLMQLSQVKSRVLMIVSHELRTPLHQAKMAAELSRQPGLDEKQRQEMYDEHDSSIRQLEHHLDDIRIFADPGDIKLSATAVGDLIQGAVEQTRRMRNIRMDNVTTDIPKGLDPVLVDISSTTRALRHIIHNAVKFGEDGPVTITARNVEDGVEIAVEDNGPGIPSELLPELFQPLRQGDDSSTRAFGGMGLGLALVKMIFDAHHIDIDLKTTTGEGTKVTVVLPRADL